MYGCSRPDLRLYRILGIARSLWVHFERFEISLITMKIARFDLNLVRILLALDQARNVTLAARSLGLSQSGFSTALAKLRRESADQLFVRGPHGMEPTSRAQELIVAGRELVSRFEAELHGARVFDPGADRTEFRIAMSDISEMALLPKLLREISALSPQCSIRTLSVFPDEMAAGLESGQIDLAIGYIPDLNSAGIYQQQLFMHTFTCLLRKDHPLRGPKLSKAQFESLDHVIVMTPIRSQELVDRTIEARKIRRNIVIRTPHFLSLPYVLAQSNLCATVPAAVGEAHTSTGLVRTVEPPFVAPKFAVHQHWHRRFANDSRNKWLRSMIFRSLGPQ